MGAKAASEPWVGRPLARLEDEALLRGEGRFIDDLDPVAEHAARRRPALAVSRTRGSRGSIRRPRSSCRGSSASSPARTSPSSRGRSRPASTPPSRTTPRRTRWRATSASRVAVVVARDRYVAEDALELIEVEYEPLEPVLDAEAAVGTRRVRVGPLVLATATSTRRSPAPTSSCASASASRAGAARRSSATASSRTGARPRARSPPGRTSRGRSRCTRSPPARSASRARSSA